MSAVSTLNGGIFGGADVSTLSRTNCLHEENDSSPSAGSIAPRACDVGPFRCHCCLTAKESIAVATQFSDMGFTLVSYNVRHQILDDGPDAWCHRRGAVLDHIQSVSPDVLGLQESTGDQQTDIEQALQYQWYGVAEEPGSGEHTPIGVGSRFAVQDAHLEWLSSTPAVQSVGWDAAYPRVLTRVSLNDRRTGRSLAVYNTHFDHKGPESRTRSARLTRERIDSMPADTEAVVLGDFNCQPGSQPYGILTADGERQLRDAQTVAATVEGPTTTVTDFTTLDPDRRLDHLFVTPGLSVDLYRIDDHTVDGRYPSDHLPVAAHVRFA